VDALDAEAVDEHLDTVVERAGGLDISFNAIGPGPASDRTPITELSAGDFARPIAFYTNSNFIPATAARHKYDRFVEARDSLLHLSGRRRARLRGRGSGPAAGQGEQLDDPS
jgi:NAD(P)-dependent dehydrogenase (short-subunit alcohol dehydrogenase family)